MSIPQPLSLLVVKSHDGTATGELYWDDGEFTGLYDMDDYSLMRLTVANNFLIACCVHCRYETITVVKAKVIYGVSEKPTDVRFNDILVNFTYSQEGQFMKVTDVHYELTDAFFMTWKC